VTLVVDANVAVKWVVPNPQAANARAVLRSGEVLIGPDLIVAEFANTLWRHVRVRDIPQEQAFEALSSLPRLLSEFVPATELVRSALHLAVAIECSVYDGFYAVLAFERRCSLVTADRRFAEKLRSSGRLPSVQMLDDFAR
jgi:predicted nucleic acid-binding protein